MGDFRKQVIKHWHSFKNPLINAILTNLEQLEKANPPLSEEDEASIEKLLTHLEGLSAETTDVQKLILLLNKLPACYMLYIIHKMQSLNNELVMKVISHAQKYKDSDTDIQLFFQRNMVFEKAQLLGRIFSNKRMDDVIKILVGEEGTSKGNDPLSQTTAETNTPSEEMQGETEVSAPKQAENKKVTPSPEPSKKGSDYSDFFPELNDDEDIK